jgi:hypothetical protein
MRVLDGIRGRGDGADLDGVRISSSRELEQGSVFSRCIGDETSTIGRVDVPPQDGDSIEPDRSALFHTFIFSWSSIKAIDGSCLASHQQRFLYQHV